METVAEQSVPYDLKAGPYSSHSLLLAALPPRGEGRLVLDVGCSTGYLARLLAGRGFDVTGIEAAGRFGAAFPPEARLVVADLDNGLPPLTGPYDFIVCGDILEHLRDPASLLGELRKVLAPGGKLVASLPNSGHAYFRLQIVCGRFPRQDKGLFDRTHLHFYTWDGWNQLFAEGGFRIVAVRSSGVPVALALPRWQDTAVVRAAERLSFLAARVWKSLFAYQFIVEAE